MFELSNGEKKDCSLMHTSVFGALPQAEKLFTPFVVSCEGLLGKEAGTFLKRLSKKLADKWRRPYSQAVSFVKTRFAISLVRAKNRCIRGSRIPTGRISHRVDWEDVAGLALHPGIELKF